MSQVRWESISLFERLDGREAGLAKALFALRSYPAGTVVVAEGEPGREMFVLVSGRVRVVKSMLLPGLDAEALGTRDARKVLATLTGENCPVFGEMSLVSDCPRSATVEALAESSFLVADRDAFFALAAREPALGCKLLTALCARLADMVRSSNSEVVKLTTALALLLADKR